MKKINIYNVFLFALYLLFVNKAYAGNFEFSLGGSFERSLYSEVSYSWTRTYGASLSYHFTAFSGIELSYQNSVERTEIEGYQDTTFTDKVYSASWVQSLTGRNTPIQPYFKLGVGQLNRDATGSYFDGLVVPATRTDSITGILAAGIRVFFTRGTAFRAEANSYLTNFSASSLGDNFKVNLGFSVYF